MKITRRALLISNAGETGEQNYCKGVAVDIANYKRLFTAAHGGSWNSDEIIAIDRPTAYDVRRHVEGLSGFDYSVIAFAGHGWYSSIDRATVLTLRKDEKISELELRKDGQRRTIILDCCREIRNQSALREEMRKE